MSPCAMRAGFLLSVIDWLVIVAYVSGLLALGLWVSRRRFAPVDYFLASRANAWYVIGLALLSSNMSSTALVGLAGGAFAVGISVYDYEWSAVVALVFFCVFMLPFVIRSGSFTMPEFLERRYDERARVLFAVLALFLNIFVDTAGVLYSGALVCRLLYPQAPLWLIVVSLASAGGLYATLGGLRAVIYTEAVQGVVLLAGACVISVAAFARAGGWYAVMHGVDASALSLIRPLGDPGVPWPGLITGIPILGFYYWCTNQSMVQRLMSAKNIEHARWGALFAGLLKLPVLFVIVMPGICALTFLQRSTQADFVYPELIRELLPLGLVGLVIAAFVAATTVATGSLLNSASTLVTIDLIRRARPQLSDRSAVRTGRWATVLLLGVAVIWTPQLENLPSLWQYLQGMLAYAVPPAVTLFGVGLFWRGATGTAAVVTMVLGSACGFILFLVNVVFGLTHLHFLYAAPILTGIDMLILVSASLWRPMTLRPAASQVMWSSGYGRAEALRLASGSLWQDYRVLAIALLLLTAAVVITFK